MNRGSLTRLPRYFFRFQDCLCVISFNLHHELQWFSGSSIHLTVRKDLQARTGKKPAQSSDISKRNPASSKDPCQITPHLPAGPLVFEPIGVGFSTPTRQ